MRKITGIKILCIVAILIVGKGMMTSIDYLSGHQTTCIFDALGTRCLGCNILAASQALRRGNIKEAWTLNPLIFVWLSIGVSLVFSEVWVFIKRVLLRDKQASSLGDWLILRMFKGIKEEEVKDVLPKVWKRDCR